MLRIYLSYINKTDLNPAVIDSLSVILTTVTLYNSHRLTIEDNELLTGK